MGKWTRRAFITTGALVGGGLLVGVGAGIAIRPGHRTPKLAKFMQNEGETLVNAWVKLLPDNSIKVIVPHAEMGQGAHTALPMMLADEMDADWTTVSMEEAPAHDEYASFHLVRDVALSGDVPGVVNDTLNGAFLKIAQYMSLQITGGSYSVRATGVLGMRIAGAAAREMLIEAAAKKWQVAASDIRTQNSMLFHDASGNSAKYIEFAEQAAQQKGPEKPRLKTPDQFNIMGHEEIKRFDIPDKVNGRAEFGIDKVLPNMQYATVKAAPVFGSQIESFDDSKAKNIKGVSKIINLGNAIAVVADSYWTAKKAIAKIDVNFTQSLANNTDSDSIFKQFANDMDTALKNGDEISDFKTGNARQVLADADKIIEAQYQVPYLAHATMEPMNCTAHYQDSSIEIWAGLQNTLGVRNNIADELKLERENVTINNQQLGGGFGRRAMKDYPLQAARIAQQLPGIPIKLIWSREEDTQQDFYRPAVSSRFKAALQANGLPSAWENQFVNKHEPTEAPDVPYAIDNKFIHYTNSETHVPFGPWRSVDHSQHAFFTESFIDELAIAAKQDPYEYRRRLLQHKPRWLHVLETAAEIADWGKTMPQGWGQGIAIQGSFNSIVAQVVDVDLTSNTPRVDKVYCAADAGYAVSPDGFKAQMESGIIYGLTAALFGNITIKKGAVERRWRARHTTNRTRINQCHFRGVRQTDSTITGKIKLIPLTNNSSMSADSTK